ncbi:MAG: UDP-N-acetylmuramoyl-L-alanine--D-glutamate ligase [Chlorobi bacterium]|nr:UDP-N-acetylmuramoyl-L-alanine--D-glutamate ligase [Chlorobiota bacterium]
MKKRLVILGAGESGIGAALLGVKTGFDVFVSDKGEIKERFRKELEEAGIAFEQGKHSEELILNADEVVKSPGIPDNAHLIVKLKEKSIPVISEIEFAGRYATGKKICITGSNGKTTTTMLIHHILTNAGIDAEPAGNVGFGFARLVAEGREPEYWVLELSSFQLDGMFSFKADVAVILNITPDHLDRYGYQMQNYVDSKFRIVRNMKENDTFVYCDDDEIITAEIKKRNIKAQLIPFSLEHKVEQGAFLDNDKIVINYKNSSMSFFTHELSLDGRHNIYNSMAAGIVSQVLRIRKKIIRDSLANFKGVEHRLEKVAAVRGIKFINDSKATNVNSAWYALECMDSPVIWIAGGTDKGNDYSELEGIVREKVKVLICLGKDNSKLVNYFKGVVPEILETSSMKDAVRTAYRMGKKGDVVLLSPACASFDLFDNYEHRGRLFKEYVRRL